MEDCEMCRNCKKDILCSNYQMHMMHCARHLTLCPACGEPIPKQEFGGHETVCTRKIKGPISASGGAIPKRTADVLDVMRPEKENVYPFSKPSLNVGSFQQRQLEDPKRPLQENTKINSENGLLAYVPRSRSAKEISTPGQLPVCQFCHLEFQGGDIEEHEDYCGSRTEKCPECSDFVLLRDLEKHQNMRLYHELAKKPCAEVFKRSHSKPRELQTSPPTSSTNHPPPIPLYKDIRKKYGLGEAFAEATSSSSRINVSHVSSPGSDNCNTMATSSRQQPDTVDDRNISGEGDLQLKKYNTSLEEQSKILEELKLDGTSTSPQFLPPRSAPNRPVRKASFDCSSSSPVTSSSSLAENELKVAEELHVDVEEQEKILRQIDAERRGKSRAKAKSSSSSRLRSGGSSRKASLKVTFDEVPVIMDSSHNIPDDDDDDFLPNLELVSNFGQMQDDVMKDVRKKKGSGIVDTYLMGYRTEAETSSKFNPAHCSCKVGTDSPIDHSIKAKRNKGRSSSPTSFRLPTSTISDGTNVNSNCWESNREALRQLLCDLRKDPMDEDLEANDGAFFPCEFCGDPYPVEYIMRHQLACDLNPSPITEGDGFDYSEIMQRAARNMEDHRTAGDATF